MKITVLLKKFNKDAEEDKEIQWITTEEGNHLPIKNGKIAIDPSKKNPISNKSYTNKNNNSLDNNIRKLPHKPQRPKKEWFGGNNERYQAAKEKYRDSISKYNETIHKIIKSDAEKPRKYDTKEAVRQWCNDNNVDIDDFVLNNVDLRIMDEIFSVHDDLFSQYPIVQDWYKSNNRKYKFSFYNDGSYFFEASNGLNFGRECKNYEDTIRKDIGNKTDGFTVMGDGTIKTTIRHEFGHNLDFAIRWKLAKENNLLDNTQLNTEDESYYLKTIDKYTNEIVSLIQRNCKTRYAYENEFEAFAEGFSEYTSNPNSKLGKAFGDFLKRWIEK